MTTPTQDTTRRSTRPATPVPDPEPKLDLPGKAAEYTAPPVQALLGRTRRSLDLLTRSRTATTAQLSVETAVGLVPAVVDRMLAGETLKPRQRSGRAYIEAAVYEYVWQFWPTTGTPVSAAVRSYAQQAARSDDDELAHVGMLQARFSDRDPRLTWQAADGTLVMDEFDFSFYSGQELPAMRPRLLADLTLGQVVADAHDRPFGGVRVLTLRRPAWQALLVTASDPDDPDTLRAVPLHDTPLCPTGTVLPAGVNR